MDTKDIKKINETLGLPRVILECDSYRFVATTVIDGTVEKRDQAWDVIFDEVNSIVCVAAESSSKDSLGKTRWSSCNFNTAKEVLFMKQLDDGFDATQSLKQKAPRVK